MTVRENILALLHYEKYDDFPVVAFGYWAETVYKWAAEGHITLKEAEDYVKEDDSGPADYSIMKKLGFDYCWEPVPAIQPKNLLFPNFGKTVLEKKEDGSQIVRDYYGLIVHEKPGVSSIPGMIGTSLTGREAWEELYLPKLQWDVKRIDEEVMKTLASTEGRELPVALHLGSLIGKMRNLIGVEELSYLYVDDEDLYVEIIDTIADLSYKCAEAALKSGAKYDYAHFWEDICYKSGPLIPPRVMKEFLVPHYKKITGLLKEYGIDIVSVDCDGMIDLFVPYWLEGGVNTMFPIEVGTWNASIGPWKETYGKELRGVGGMNKNIFAQDYKAIDAEIERLKPLIEMGGFIPCPDHRIPPEGIWENVQYYCDKMHNLRL